MRCLALADEFRHFGWSCTFKTTVESLGVLSAMARSGHRLAFVDGPSACEFPEVSDVTVLDHYGLRVADEAEAAKRSRRVVVIEDRPSREHVCDVLVDQNPSASADQYKALVSPSVRVLTGSRYALLARGWRLARQKRAGIRVSPTVGRLVVSMGATDGANATARALAAIEVAGLAASTDIILGPAAPHLDAIGSELKPSMRLHIDPHDLIDIVANADLLIGAAGVSSLERGILGVPSIVTTVADNQDAIAASLWERGAVQFVSREIFNNAAGLAEVIRSVAQSADRRQALADHSKALTDGLGTRRVFAAAAGCVVTGFGAEVSLRLAEAEDCDWLFKLQHQPGTRDYANARALPSGDEHRQWFETVTRDEDRLLLIVEADGVRGGMLRLDHAPSARRSYVVSIAIDAERRGTGIGTAALELARRLVPAADLVAEIAAENRASLALFAACGYRPSSD